MSENLSLQDSCWPTEIIETYPPALFLKAFPYSLMIDGTHWQITNLDFWDKNIPSCLIQIYRLLADFLLHIRKYGFILYKMRNLVQKSLRYVLCDLKQFQICAPISRVLCLIWSKNQICNACKILTECVFGHFVMPAVKWCIRIFHKSAFRCGFLDEFDLESVSVLSF